MRSIENWQYTVHALNQRKGFYDYEKDIELAEGWLADARAVLAIDPLTVEMQGKEIDAIGRIVADYRKAMHERKLLLVIGELCEAHEEMRSGRAPAEIYFSGEKNDKPEGVPIELADAQIRLWDLEQAMKIDGEYCATLKHEYNESRPHKHGRQF